MYKPVRDVRIALCETFASPYARHSHRFMRDVRIALCETFASPYARCSYRSMRDIRSVRIEMSVTVGIRCLSNVGEALYPIPERHFIQYRRSSLSKSDDKAQCISRYKKTMCAPAQSYVLCRSAQHYLTAVSETRHSTN